MVQSGLPEGAYLIDGSPNSPFELQLDKLRCPIQLPLKRLVKGAQQIRQQLHADDLGASDGDDTTLWAEGQLGREQAV